MKENFGLNSPRRSVLRFVGANQRRALLSESNLRAFWRQAPSFRLEDPLWKMKRLSDGFWFDDSLFDSGESIDCSLILQSLPTAVL
jgi:hypothetical protein